MFIITATTSIVTDWSSLLQIGLTIVGAASAIAAVTPTPEPATARNAAAPTSNDPMCAVTRIAPLPACRAARLSLERSERYDNGVVYLHYRPAG